MKYIILLLAVVWTVQSPHAALVGKWALNEGSGTIASDASGGGSSGTLNGSLSWQSSYLHFEGTGYVDIADKSVLDFNQHLSIALNVKLNSQCSGKMTFLSKSGARGYELGFDCGAGSLYLMKGDWTYATASVDFDTNWHHLTAVIDGGAFAFYIDRNQLTPAATQTADSMLWAGGMLKGALSDVHVFSHVLSSTEIKELASSTVAAIAPLRQTAPAPGRIRTLLTPTEVMLRPAHSSVSAYTFFTADGKALARIEIDHRFTSRLKRLVACRGASILFAQPEFSSPR
ncbi:MAG: hypothetical protein GF398_09865 [Chitinivibrionales bacterium]|nr:hypothetical protein [Chitinivibrionales bacterium]